MNFVLGEEIVLVSSDVGKASRKLTGSAESEIDRQPVEYSESGSTSFSVMCPTCQSNTSTFP